ncbi:MAG TPA: hypothetical protein VGG14_13220 [Candidatus Sulfotelmatobacter sp.]
MAKLLNLISVLIITSSVFAQQAQIREQRRPAANATATPSDSTKQPNYEYFSILDGTPILLQLHHDTQVGTNDPIDVYDYVIELQVLNSDGDLEPEGLQIHNFYTARPVHPLQAPNPHNARDCATWNTLVQNEITHRNQNSPTWSYVEFTVAQGARVIQTNEDGAVWWSDDVECWGSRDRFAPF